MPVIQSPDAEEGGSGMQGYSCLNNNFEASLGYILNVKNQTTNNNNSNKISAKLKGKEHWREGQMFKNNKQAKTCKVWSWQQQLFAPSLVAIKLGTLYGSA